MTSPGPWAPSATTRTPSGCASVAWTVVLLAALFIWRPRTARGVAWSRASGRTRTPCGRWARTSSPTRCRSWSSAACWPGWGRSSRSCPRPVTRQLRHADDVLPVGDPPAGRCGHGHGAHHRIHDLLVAARPHRRLRLLGVNSGVLPITTLQSGQVRYMLVGPHSCSWWSSAPRGSSEGSRRSSSMPDVTGPVPPVQPDDPTPAEVEAPTTRLEDLKRRGARCAGRGPHPSGRPRLPLPDPLWKDAPGPGCAKVDPIVGGRGHQDLRRTHRRRRGAP